MNRKDEYNEWLAELEQTVPALDGTLIRAQKRRKSHAGVSIRFTNE